MWNDFTSDQHAFDCLNYDAFIAQTASMARLINFGLTLRRNDVNMRLTPTDALHTENEPNKRANDLKYHLKFCSAKKCTKSETHISMTHSMAFWLHSNLCEF